MAETHALTLAVPPHPVTEISTAMAMLTGPTRSCLKLISEEI